MRLINTQTLELQEFHMADIPSYAILSHTWGKDEDEVLFKDMASPNRISKKGFRKIHQTCRLAQGRGLQYAWVDTCSIDKSSSAELSESINSMFNWYRDAEVCFAFLEDFRTDMSAKDDLTRCRWFTRGWTLQELIAPRNLEFYDTNWRYLGSKLDFTRAISQETGIPKRVLKGEQTLAYCSVAMRMAWAASRSTTRVEDIAYSLLGLFNVNMPLIYGEGPKAFRRLQEEIVRQCNDLSIFAWEDNVGRAREACTLFAASPRAFANAHDIVTHSGLIPVFSVTKKGILVSDYVSLPLARVTTRPNDDTTFRYLLTLGKTGRESDTKYVGIYLCMLGPKTYYRDAKFGLFEFGEKDVISHHEVRVADFNILVDYIDDSFISMCRFRFRILHIPSHNVFELKEAVPQTLFDHVGRDFWRPGTYPFPQLPMVLAMTFEGRLGATWVTLVVLCDFRANSHVCRVFLWESHPYQAAMIFNGKYRYDPVLWADIEFQAPELLRLSNSVVFRSQTQVFNIAVACKIKWLQHPGEPDRALPFLRFDIT